MGECATACVRSWQSSGCGRASARSERSLTAGIYCRRKGLMPTVACMPCHSHQWPVHGPHRSRWPGRCLRDPDCTFCAPCFIPLLCADRPIFSFFSVLSLAPLPREQKGATAAAASASKTSPTKSTPSKSAPLSKAPRNPPPSKFRLFYDRGDLPIVLSQVLPPPALSKTDDSQER